MRNPLWQQIEDAPGYLWESWPNLLERARALAEGAHPIQEVLICGCGDSHHAAMGLELTLRWSLGTPVRACDSMTAARYLLPEGRPEEGLCLVAISVSGEVARTVEAVEAAEEVGAATLAFTANPESTLASKAGRSLAIDLPDLPTAPGLLSYLGTLMAGFAFAAVRAREDLGQALMRVVGETASLLEDWIPGEVEQGIALAQEIQEQGMVYLGSGPAAGAANFAAAKLIEAAGEPAWAREVEEWAHLDYFCEPASMPTWLLSASGRCVSRETEVEAAAQTLGRRWACSRWEGGRGWPGWLREAISPLALWAGPAALAARRAELLGEQPFRGFSGGREAREGGGASRIRSSQRLAVSALEAPDRCA